MESKISLGLFENLIFDIRSFYAKVFDFLDFIIRT